MRSGGGPMMEPAERRAAQDSVSGGGVRTGSGSGTYYDRISRLSERLSGLQQGLEHERHSRFDNLTHRVVEIEGRLDDAHGGLHQECDHLRDQLEKFRQEFEDERVSREAMTGASAQEVGNLDLRLMQALEAEQHARREAETRTLRGFDEKTAQLRDELAREGRTRVEAEAALSRYVDVDIPKLYESLREEAGNRQTMENRILKRATDEIARLEDAIIVEKKAREDAEEGLLRMMEDAVSRMRNEIAQERADREATEETLLRLLEETCNKLKAASQIM